MCFQEHWNLEKADQESLYRSPEYFPHALVGPVCAYVSGWGKPADSTRLKIGLCANAGQCLLRPRKNIFLEYIQKICCAGSESSLSMIYSVWTARKTAWSRQPLSICSVIPWICKTIRICGSCYPSWSKFRCPKCGTGFSTLWAISLQADYQRLLELCRVFLKRKSFTFSGRETTLMLLFPMERIFESYVMAVLQQHLDFKQYRVYVQVKGKYLFELP